MAFCGNCGTKAVGEFCVNCGKSTQAIVQPIQPIQVEPAPIPEAKPVVYAPVVETPPQTVEVVAPQEVAQPKVLEEVATGYIAAENPQAQSVSPELTEEQAQDSPKGQRSKKVPLIVGGSLMLLAGLLFPGSGEVTVVYNDYTSDENPAVNLTLQINGEDIRIAKDANGELIYTGTWSSFQPSELSVIPDPKNDEVISISMPQFGSLGIWNINKTRTITISAFDRSLDVDISGGDNFSEVRTVMASRSFYERDLAGCKEDFNDDFGYAINLRRNSYTNYLSFVEDAQLDGTRTLQYTTWASRADNLQAKITNYLSLFEDNSLTTDNTTLNSSGSDVQSAITDLRAAWKNLESVSRSESDSKWDAAWTRIYNAETALYDKVDSFAATAKGVGGKICLAQLTRG